MQPGSKLAIGQRLEIGIGGAWRVTRLQDHDAGGSVLTVSWPTDRERRLVAVTAGETVQVAVSSPQDALYSARATIEQVSRAGVPMLVLRVTGLWQRTQRRGAARVAVAIRPRRAVRVDRVSRKPVRVGISNLSANGLRVRSLDELRAGDWLELAFSVIGIADELEVSAIVRRVEHYEQRSVYVWEAGCELQCLPPRLAQKLVQFVFAQQRLEMRSRRTA
ncbi:MAG: flagellar brake protein [Chloroflexota bacterium]|nr:flagellar brake protein [Chloroflexota bacterium]